MVIAEVQTGEDSIAITDEHGEIVYWDEKEWIEDPKLVLSIVYAVKVFYEHGPQELRNRIRDSRGG